MQRYANLKNVAHNARDHFDLIQTAWDEVSSRTQTKVALPSERVFIAPVRVVKAHFHPKSSRTKIFKAPHYSLLNVFFVAHFVRTTVLYGMASFSFLCGSLRIDYLLNLKYYSRIWACNTSVICHITLPGFCSWHY